jgi:hypothetical protein
MMNERLSGFAAILADYSSPITRHRPPLAIFEIAPTLLSSLLKDSFGGDRFRRGLRNFKCMSSCE